MQMKASFIVIVFIVFNNCYAALPVKNSVNGFVRDKSNGESLPSANVMIKDLRIGAVTNAEGYFVLPDLPAGVFTVQVSLLGYKTEMFQVNTIDSQYVTRMIQMESESLQEKEVVVTGDRLQEQKSIQTGYLELKGSEFSSIPSVGEADVFRALKVLPGVKAVSEISSGLFVRGGSADQNLILLDGTVVYNPSHLFGLFSTFNNDAVKDVELMKGGYPAEYGGRLSSVLNVTNIDGDRVSTHGKGSISLISTRLTGEGPIGNGSWFLSGRRTYFDQLVKLAGRDAGKNAIPLYYFYDANMKLNQDFGLNDKISVVGYFGNDNMDYKLGRGELKLDMNWGNNTVSGKWTHVFSPTVFSNFNLTYSKYLAHTAINVSGMNYTQENSIRDLSLKSDINFYPTNDHLVKFGLWLSQYRITYIEQTGEGDKYEFISNPSQISLYAQDEWYVSPLLKLQTGVHAEYQTLTHSTTVGPRFSGRYFLKENLAVKFATGIYYQYLNAIPIGDASGFSPFDIWVPIDDKMKPSRSIDLVLGLETEPIQNHPLSIEGYYKAYKDVLYWIGEPTRTKNINELFYVGTGRAFGAELFFQRRLGDITGSISYTLAWTYRTFPDLNSGKEFMPKYDRRHDLSVIGNYQLAETWKLGFVFTYSTGQSFTAGIARYAIQTPVGSFEHILPGDLYNYRLPPYHRMDVSITKRTTFFGLKGSWYIQIYNIYNHENVWYREFDTQKNPTKVTDVTLLPFIPTFGIDFEF
jgi:hypothetical protein